MNKRIHKQRKRKIPTRMLALLLSFSFLWNDAAIVSLAAESGEEKNTEESYRQALEEFDSYKEELNTLYEGIDFKAAEEKEDSYTSHVLIVQLKGGMNTAVPSTNPRYVMDLGDGLFAVSYPDADSTKDAEAVLKESSEISYVEPDYVLKTCDLMEESEQESGEEETDNPVPESGIEENLMENDNGELNVTETGAYQEETSTLQETENLVLESNLSTNASSAQENSESTEENVPEEIPEEKVRVILLDDVDSEEEGSFHGNHVQDVFWNSLSENGGNADGVEFISLSAFDKNGYGTTLTTYLSVHTAMKLDADVLIMPFAGNGESELFTRLFDETKDKGMFLVSSIGNEGTDAEMVLPAQHKNVISIGSVTAGKERCGYSNYGENLDFVCYGKYKTTDGETFRGTSASCAYFAGYAVSIKEKNREMAVNELLDSLKNEAEDLGAPGKDEDYGYGLIGGIPEGAVDEMADAPAAKEEDESSKSEDKTKELETQEPETYIVGAGSPLQIYQYGNGYVGVELRNYSSCGDMRIAVWCTENGQDDLYWYNMTKRDDGVWVYTIPLSNHGQEGSYTVYAFCGNTLMATGEFQVSGPSATGAFVGDTGSTDSLYAYVFNLKQGSNSISKVQLAVWTEENGQDDLRFYDAGQAWSNADGTTYVAAFDIKNHNRLASGTYNVGAYVTDLAGIKKFVAFWQGTATCTSSYNPNQSKTGYHVEKVGTESCYHDTSGCAFVTCFGQGLAPSDDYLWAKRYVSNPTLNVTWRWAPDFSNYGIGNDQISHQVLIATVDGFDVVVAAPYWCPDGYAGYAYFYFMFSYCDKCDKWMYVGTAHQWLGCARGDVGENEYHPMSYDHTVDVWGLKPNQYTLRFHGNGANSGSMADQSCSYDVDYNISKNQFQRTGYTFKGWSVEANSSSIAFTDQQRVSKWDVPHGWAIDLYAVWEPNAYYIDYDLNGATYIDQNTLNYLNSIKYLPDQYYSIPDANTFANKYNRVNYDAAGGTCTSNGTGESYDEGYSAFLGWDSNIIGYDSNWNPIYGTLSQHGFNDAYYANIYPDVMEAFGYDKLALWNHYYYWGKNEGRSTSSGHNLDNLTSMDLYQPGKAFKNMNVAANGNTTLTARWKDPTVKLPTPTRIGYTFTGWYKEDETYVGKGGDSYTLSGTSTLHAKWKENEYTLVFDGNGADIGSMESLTVHYNDTLTLPKNLYENTTIPCTYMGWIHDKDALKADYGDEEELEVKKIIKKAGKEAEDGATITLYAFWDIAPEIEAYDLYYTLADAQAGVISEEELLSHAAAYDEELKTDKNPDGEMVHGTYEAKNTSFTVSDYSESDFMSFTKSGKVSITYEAVDAAGNHTKKMVDVHIIDPDAKNMLKAKGDIRFISSKYLDTLREDSVWRTEEEYQNLLNETLSYKRTNPDTSDPLPVFGDAYKRTIEGTGTWNKTPKAEWRFTKEQIGEVKEYLDTYGPSNYQTENGLSQFMDTFGTCKVK